MNAFACADITHPFGCRVLVVGCNTGLDCRYFIDLGAAAVHGVDVVDEIGRDFQHPRVHYHQTSAERMPVMRDRSFDIVYTFATMEHVPRIDLAFAEFARVLKPGGLLYSVAAPLWNSPQGHHKADFFADFPWIHLRLTRAEIVRHCELRGMKGMAAHVDYMLDQRYFNKTRASEYVDVCSRLSALRIVSNQLDLLPADTLSDEVFAELSSKGYDRRELLATVHRLIAFGA